MITALAIPVSRPDGSSPLQETEHALQPWVAFAILPMFAVLIPLILAIGAFAINVAWMSLVDSEIQIASDTSARAAGTEFVLQRRSPVPQGLRSGATPARAGPAAA